MIISILVLTIPITVFIILISSVSRLDAKYEFRFIDKMLSTKTTWYLFFIFLLLTWVIYWLAYFPGIVDFDNTYNYQMYRSNIFTTHHPILHVLTLGFFFDLGYNFFSSYNTGVSFYIIFQMIICAISITWILKRLYLKHKVNRFIILLAFIFYSGIVLPIIPINIITSTKDALFSTFSFVFLVLNYEMIKDYNVFSKSKLNILIYIIFGFFSLSLRNNFYYAYLPFALFLSYIFLRRKEYKGILIVISVVTIFLSSNAWFINAFNIKDVSSVKEMSSVPLQQLARVYNRNNLSLSDSDKQLLIRIVGHDDLIQYNPYWSDFIKRYFNQQVFIDNKDEYIQLYCRTLKNNPSIFIDSFLENTLFSWYPFAVNESRYTLYDKGLTSANTSFLFITDVNQPATLDSKIPHIYSIIQSISYENQVSNVPIYSLLYSIGFMFWLFLYCIMISIYRKDWNILNVSILVILYTATLWLGPVMFIRYFLYLWFLFPIMLGYIFSQKNNTYNNIYKIKN